MAIGPAQRESAFYLTSNGDHHSYRIAYKRERKICPWNTPSPKSNPRSYPKLLIHGHATHGTILEHLEQQTREAKELGISQTSVVAFRFQSVPFGRAFFPSTKKLNAVLWAIAPSTIQHHGPLHCPLLGRAAVRPLPDFSQALGDLVIWRFGRQALARLAQIDGPATSAMPVERIGSGYIAMQDELGYG